MKCPLCQCEAPVDALAPVAELAGTQPLVLYFDTEQDRQEFMAIWNEAKPSCRTVKL